MLMRKHRPALTESEHISRCATSDAREPCSHFWAVSQAKSARNAARRRRFPRSAEPTANDPRRKPHRSPDPWRNRRPLPAKPPRSRGGATAGKAAATVAPARAQPEASRGTPAGEAAAADEHAGMLIGCCGFACGCAPRCFGLRPRWRYSCCGLARGRAPATSGRFRRKWAPISPWVWTSVRFSAGVVRRRLRRPGKTPAPRGVSGRFGLRNRPEVRAGFACVGSCAS